MRIAIITFHRAYNCGAMLQAWALKTILERMGHVVFFPSCNEVGYDPPSLMVCRIPREKRGWSWVRSFLGRAWLDLTGRHSGFSVGRFYDKFRKRYLPEVECDETEFGKYFDCLIYGSDQIFNERLSGAWTEYFRGRNVKADVPKIVYAASLGDCSSGEKLDSQLLADLNRFTAVSLREPFRDYPIVLDPTMLLSMADFNTLDQGEGGEDEPPYLYLYTCTLSPFEIELSRAVAKRMRLRLKIAYPLGRQNHAEVPEVVANISPSQMIHDVRYSACMMAGSFHGTALAIIYNKSFVTIRPRDDSAQSRPAALLKRLGLLDRLITPSVPQERVIPLLKSELSIRLEERITFERMSSMMWLSNALSSIQKHKDGV